MKKLKFLLLTLVATISVGAWAQKDVTSTYIKNSTLSSLDGWTNNNFNAPQQGNNTVGYASEAYAGYHALEKTSYSLTQKITLPKGNYRLVNYSFYREKEGANDEPGTSRAFLKAGEKQVAIKTLGSITPAGYANSQAEGANCFDSKMYRNTVDFAIDEDDTEIEVGLYGTFKEIRSWCIAGMFELWDLDEEASESDPADMTYLITNPGFEYRDATGWTSTGNGGGYAAGEAFAKSGVGFAEKWQSGDKRGLGNGTFYQEISLPAGLYEVKVRASNLEQYNGDAGGTGMFLVANDAETEIGAFNTYSAKTKVTTGKLKLGIKLNSATGNWIAFDRFELNYLGVDLDDLKSTLASVIADAKALYSSKMAADVLQALKDKVTEAESVEQKASAIKAVTEQLQNAITTAKASIADYAKFKAAIELANAIYENSDESVTGAKDEFKPYIVAMEEEYDNGTFDDVKTAADNLAAAQAIYMSKSTPIRDSGVKYDFTSKMNMAINAWTCKQGNGPAQYGTTGATETYNSGGPYVAGKVMYQTITGLANGEYEVQFYGVANSANGVSDAEGPNIAQAYANSTSLDIELKLQDSCTPSASEYLRTITCTVTDGTLEFGLKNIAEGGNWYLCKAVALYMTGGPNLDDYYTAIAENLEIANSVYNSTSPMNKDIKSALGTAISNADDYATVTVISELEKLNKDLTDATAAAKKSIADYETLKNAYTLAETLYKESADGATDFDTAITAAQSGYTNADVNGEEATATMKAAIETYLSANNTGIVVNGTFDSNNAGWISTTGATGQGLANNKTGDFSGKFWENWNSSPKTGKMYQTNAKILPVGNYLLRIAAFGDQVSASDGSNLYVYANDQKKSVVSDVPTYYYVPFTLTANAPTGTIEFGLTAEEGNKSAWLGIDNVSIYFLDGMNNFYATEDDYKALADALSNVSDKVFGFEAGEYAPYNNIEAAKAIAHAKTIDNTVENIAVDVRIATNAIKDAEWVVNETEVNAVYNGNFGLSIPNETTGVDVDMPGWTANSSFRKVIKDVTTYPGLADAEAKAAVFTWGCTAEYGMTGGYTMPLKASTTYMLTFKQAGWEGANNSFSAKILKDGVEVTSQVYSKAQSYIQKANSLVEEVLFFTTTDAGDYVLNLIPNGNTTWTDVCIVKAASFDATLTKVGDAAYSTMYLDFPVEIPEDVEAYYVTVDGRTATMNEIEGVIPANCGVVLKAEDAGTVTFTQTSTAATTDVSSNVLIGFVEDTEVDNGKAHYAFSYKNDKVAFYIPASAENNTDPTSKFTAKANKAYIELEGASSSSQHSIAWGDEVTGINTIDNGQWTIDNSNAYNLNGIRVSSSYKGIVLKGNKKFLQK